MTFALVTPSFAPDFTRCRLLVESVERLVAPNTHHYVIVDHRDHAMFAPLASTRVTVCVVEDLLPGWLHRDPAHPQSWLCKNTQPVTNWVLQQVVKMSIFQAIPEDIAIFCDSDNVFIRPFNPENRLMDHRRLALFRTENQNNHILAWRDATSKLLGLSHLDTPAVNYVSNLIGWRRENVSTLHARIEHATGMNWLEAVCQYTAVSEYVLYGTLVEHLVGVKEAGHKFFSGKLIKPSWGKNLQSPQAMHEFFAEIDKDYVGVMIHSKDNLPVDAYAPLVRTYWT
ncbi:MAG TPA: DUF6492 family protein [Kiritimatiellia bacterium]|nr:DUF6492 family protein [Kiritimatiellia bacterium]